MAPLLTFIFNQSLQNGQVPADWRHGNIFPLHKKGSKSLATNYRPISLTSVCSKIMELIIYSNLCKHLTPSVRRPSVRRPTVINSVSPAVTKGLKHYGILTPRQGTGTFRAEDFSFSRTNSTFGELSFRRLFIPWEWEVPRNFRSQALSFRGTFVPGEQKFLGTFVPWTFRSEALSFPGLFVPRNFHSSDYFTRHWLWTHTATATVRICFVVGLVVFVFQK